MESTTEVILLALVVLLVLSQAFFELRLRMMQKQIDHAFQRLNNDRRKSARDTYQSF